MPRKKSKITLEIGLFQEVWRYLKVANPPLAAKIKAYIVKVVCKDGEIPEEWQA